jgi:hypothetical protein
MENTIEILKDLREKIKKEFLDYSIIVHHNKGKSCPLPDTERPLKMIIELNEAIIVLESYIVQEPQKAVKDTPQDYLRTHIPHDKP